MTNLFDGVSFIVEANDGSGSGDTSGVGEERIKELIADVMRSFAEDLLEK